MSRLPTLLCLGGLMAALAEPALGQADDGAAEAEMAAQALRRVATNIQFHKDGAVRLVRLSKPAVTDESLAHLRHFARLDYLAVACPQVTDAGLAHVQQLSQLDTLLLSQSGISGRSLAFLTGLSQLQRLYLGETQVDDASLAHLPALEALRVLSLDGTPVTNAGLAHVGQIESLEVLLLCDNKVSDQGLSHFRDLKELQALYLDGTAVTGSGLEHLQGLQNLRHLSLSHTALSDFDALAGLTQLEHLELWGVSLAADQLTRLQSALSGTSIHIESPSLAVGEDAGKSPAAAARPPLERQLAWPSIRQRLADGEQATPDFQRHVIPLLGRLGCNGRACHGSFQGQGGFRLSMFGYDFQMDHENLRQRIDLESPDDSLILNKPTSEDEHGGGLRLPPGGWQQDLLRRWIARGAAGVPANAPRFVALEVTPEEIVFGEQDKTAQLQVHAVWSDGTREDVTCLTRFQSNDETVSVVSPDGMVRSAGPGDTHIISFYDNGVVATPVLRPVSSATAGEQYPDVPAPTRIDQLVVAKLVKLGVVPSELSSDEEFLRRVSLDMIGTLPTPAEIREFVVDPAADKRRRKIDQLLKRPEYVTWWTLRLCDLTGSNAGYLGSTEMAQPMAAQWRSWIERRVRDNVPWHHIVRGIVLARSRRSGQSYREFVQEQSGYTRRDQPRDIAAEDSLPHFWFRSNIPQPADRALAFGYIFLGVRLQCAQCHKHPFDQWSKQDFEQFTEFFTRIQTGVAPDGQLLREQMREMLGVPVKLNTAALRRQSYLRIAAEGRPIPWKEVHIAPPSPDDKPARLLGGDAVDLRRWDDPRRPLMDWLLGEPNRYLARSFVNRIWAHYFHVGLVDPPDDLNLANPPSNQRLLDYLTDEFIRHEYNIQWLHREITSSRTYQLSWRANSSNQNDERNFSRAVLRRLPAEVAVDAIAQATAASKQLDGLRPVAGRKIGSHPRSYQARVIDYSLLIFGKPLRTTNCDCERQDEPTLLQALYVRNDGELLQQLDRPDGWLNELAARPPTQRPAVEELIEEAYLRTVSRRPTDQERRDCRQHFAAGSEDADVIEPLRDLMWALLNTQEFITNH